MKIAVSYLWGAKGYFGVFFPALGWCPVVLFPHVLCLPVNRRLGKTTGRGRDQVDCHAGSVDIAGLDRARALALASSALV